MYTQPCTNLNSQYCIIFDIDETSQMKTDLCYKHNIIVSLFHCKKVNPSSLLLQNIDVMTTVYGTAILLRDPYGNTNIE